MGSTTTMTGDITLDRPLTAKQAHLLRAFTHEFDRHGIVPVHHQGRNAPENLGKHGGYCAWLLQDDNRTLRWDGWEKNYNNAEWLAFIIDRFIRPTGRVANGKVLCVSERTPTATEGPEIWMIVVKDNHVRLADVRIEALDGFTPDRFGRAPDESIDPANPPVRAVDPARLPTGRVRIGA